MVRYFLYGTLFGLTIMAVVFLNGWNKGFDVGYGAAMSDVFLNLKSPDDYFKQFFKTPTRSKDERH
jgi:hypothetical protein